MQHNTHLAGLVAQALAVHAGPGLCVARVRVSGIGTEGLSCCLTGRRQVIDEAVEANLLHDASHNLSSPILSG